MYMCEDLHSIYKWTDCTGENGFKALKINLLTGFVVSQAVAVVSVCLKPPFKDKVRCQDFRFLTVQGFFLLQHIKLVPEHHLPNRPCEFTSLLTFASSITTKESWRQLD